MTMPHKKLVPRSVSMRMRARFAFGLLLLAACGGPARREPIPGLRTEIELLDREPVVGGPLRVRLTLVNDGPERVVYYDLARTAFDLTHADGSRARFIDGPRSTGHWGDYPALEPGARVALLDDHDLSSLFLIDKPGRWTIVGAGIAWARLARDYSENDDPWTRDEPSYPSNTLVVEVRPGPLPLKTELAARLHGLTPKDWYFACDWWPGVEGPDVSFIPPNFKSGLGNLRIRVHDGPAEMDEVKLTKFRNLPVYARTFGSAESLWPGWRTAVTDALRP